VLRSSCSPWVTCIAIVIWLPLTAAPARALDKQASAHGGNASATSEGFGISSSLLAGVAVYNPTYAARPDNTGRALLRLAPHLDIDLLGRRLSIPIDINLFTDRNLPGFAKLVPSELDLISGVTSTWPIGPTALELGVRRSGTSRRTSTLERVCCSRARASGRVCAEPSPAVISAVRRRWAALAPSELDFTAEIGAHLVADVDLHVAYERDMPIDRGGMVQHFITVFLTWDFTWLPVEHPATKPPPKVKSASQPG